MHKASDIHLTQGQSIQCIVTNARICRYLKSVLRYKFVIMDTFHRDILYVVREQGCEDTCLIFEAAKGVREQKSLESTGLDRS